MNNPQSHKRDLLRSILTTSQYLFIPTRDPVYLYWMLGAITCIGMVMRLWKIEQPVAYDEAYTFIHFATRQFKHILADYSAPNNHIFHTILVYLSYKVFGNQPWVLRLPAFIVGTACIPAAYLAARRLCDGHQALAAAALVALPPLFIDYSANGRGYTLIILFSLLLANLGALLIHRQSRTALAAYAVTVALGFYTIPIFLYPMAGISLWVLASHLSASEPSKEKLQKAWTFLAACLLAGLLTLLLYAPVIVFGTGLDSITSNEFVESRDGALFIENLRPRAIRTWESWMQGFAEPVQVLLAVGFLLSVLFYRKASKQRVPLQVFLILTIPLLLMIQRVVPLARVWMYLGAFYLLFAGAGLVWLAELMLKSLGGTRTIPVLLPALTLLAVIGVFAMAYLNTQRGPVAADRNRLPEEYAADYLATHLQAGDTILSVSPTDMQTAYYLHMNGISYDVFYRRDHPVTVQNGIIVLRTNSKYNTPESVLDFYKITPDFDLGSARLVYEYGQVHVFSVPAK